MNTEEQTMPAVLIQCFNNLSEIYGFRRYSNSAGNSKGLKNALNWIKEVPHLAPRDFIEAQIRAVEESRRRSISFGTLFKTKTVCMHRLGVDAQLTATSYEDYLVYFDVLSKNFEKAVTNNIPGPWYSCKDDILLDPNRKYPKWFIIMEITDTATIPDKMLQRFIKSIQKEHASEPALKKLLKVKYERNSDTKYHERLARWL
jgi:hypothetical protein